MFDSFDAQLIDIDDGQIFCLTGGNGPPLLLLHGYPETHVMWHKIAAPLAQDFRLIIPDLRGYGDSMIVPGDTDHYNYSKRRMAQDMAEIMTVLGHDKFMVAGHDRGGRVAHRLARDHRDRVQALSVLDICPTLDMYESTDMDFATAYFHWFFLIQPYDLPEKMIMSNPDQWMENCLQKWSGGFDFGDAVLEYQKNFSSLERIHATCEDYRAAATIDLDHDRVDRGEKLDIPLQVLWGERGVVGRKFKPLQIWQHYTDQKVVGHAMPTGHFIPEEDPEGTCAALESFFSQIS